MSVAYGAVSGRSLYFAIWRWHFYAALYVIPFILTLAVTGLAMLWFTAVAPESGERIAVAAGSTDLSPSAQSEAALRTHPGATLKQYIAAWDATSPAIVQIDAADGVRMVAVDPYSGAVLRDTLQDATWNSLANRIHGSLLLGDVGDWLIEIAAGFGIILVVTGLFLWWPRDRAAALSALWPDLGLRGRALWKSLHQTIGTWFSVVLLFFLVSGLAWTGVWGAKLVQAWSTFPAAKFDSVPLSDKSHASMNHGAEKDVPWTLEQTPMPASGSMAGMDGTPPGRKVDLDAVVALGRSLGFAGRFHVTPPAGATGVYTLSKDSQSYDSHAPGSDRTVHVDQYTGKVLADIRFADYGAGGKAMAVGIALHEGALGVWNIVLNAVFILAILMMSASGLVMWWQRRPSGAIRLGAPPVPADHPGWKAAMILMLVLSFAFPLTGTTLLTVLLLDLFVVRNVRSVARFLS